MLRSFVSKDINLLMRAFIVYVCPIVQYCSVVWSPSLKHGLFTPCLKDIEKVQRRFTKRLPGLKHTSYNERLCYFGLPSLELRRLYFDLIYCYKIVFGVVNLNFSDLFLKIQLSNCHAYKSCKPRLSILYLYFSRALPAIEIK